MKDLKRLRETAFRHAQGDLFPAGPFALCGQGALALLPEHQAARAGLQLLTRIAALDETGGKRPAGRKRLSRLAELLGGAVGVFQTGDGGEDADRRAGAVELAQQ